MKEKQTQMWIPLYVDKWIFGSTRIELEPAERSVFVDLLAFGAKDQGFIRANETTAYPHTQLSGLLNISVALLQSTIVKCLHFEKLIEPAPGIYRLKNWEEYQLSKSYISMLENGKRPIPGTALLTKSLQELTKGLPRREEKIGEEKIGEEKIGETTLACPHTEIVARYHAILPELAKVKEWTPARKAFLRGRWAENKERQNLAWWEGFFKKVKASDFLCGRTRDFKATMEWLVRPTNFIKVIEGNYDNRHAGSDAGCKYGGFGKKI